MSAADASARMAKRLSLAHCHAPAKPIRATPLAIGELALGAEQLHRLLHLRSGSWRCDGRALAAPASLILRAGERVALHCTQAGELALAPFSTRLPGGGDALSPFGGRLLVAHPVDAPVLKAWTSLLDTAEACRQGDAWARARLRGAFTLVLAHSIEAGCAAGWLLEQGRPAWLDAVLERIEGDLQRGIDLDALAGLAHLSPSRFAHVFRDEMGIAPKAYAVQRRLERARGLLAGALGSAPVRRPGALHSGGRR